MDLSKLKQYQAKRKKCQYLKDRSNEGAWCAYLDKKCCLANCPDTLPLVSSGKQKSPKKGYHYAKVSQVDGSKSLSEMENKILQLRQKGYSFKTIANMQGKSKSMIHKIYQKLIRVYKGNQVDDKGVGGRSISPLVDEKHMISSHEHIIRLHNDNIKLKIEKISFLMEKTVKLRYAEYKVIQDPEKYIQVFTNGTLTIRFRKDIIARSPEEARDKADLRLKLFINDCKIPGIAINGRSEQLSRDYAILGTDLAKKYVSERRKFFYFDQTDGRCRAEIDLSHARPEYETPHPHKGFLDADKSKKVFDDLNDGNIAYWGNILENERHSWDLPTVTKQKTDLLLNDFKESKQILAGYAEQIKLHLEVEKRTNKVLMQMEKHLGKLSR